MDQDATRHGARPRPRRLYIRWGPRSPFPKKGRRRGAPPQKISAHVYCGQTAGWTKMALGMEIGLNPGDFVLDGDPALLPKRGRIAPPQFSVHFYCGQTAGCIKMPLCMEVSLSPGDFVRWGSARPLNFLPITACTVVQAVYRASCCKSQ